MGTVISKGPCPRCSSSDACATYDDGSDYCYSCKTYGRNGAPAAAPEGVKDWSPIPGYYGDLVKRGIREDTCRKFGYQQGERRDGSKIHIQNVRGERGELLGQKTRDKDKNFAWNGPAGKDPGIIGSWLWPSDGRRVVITEGEIDMLSMAQAFDGKYHYGSLPNGAGSVEKAIKKDYDKLCRFESIILCFDNDAPGQEALTKACSMLPVGKVKIMTLPTKDANEALLDPAYGPAALVRAFWDAKVYRPDGIVEGRAFTKERLKRVRRAGYDLPWPQLNEKLMGLRKGEITMLTAGSGIGKSTLARAMAYHMRVEHGLKIGNIYLEEDNDTSVDAYVGLHLGVPLKDILKDPTCVPDDLWDAALEAVIWDEMIFYDHFGSLASDRLLTMMYYMAAAGCDFVVLDHVSIVTSGLESSSEGERKDIDILMTKLASYVKATGVGVITIVHLKRKPGTSFNEGGQVSLSDLRGSGALEQLSYNAVSLERNQQDEKKKHLALLRVLKCRITGDTGTADTLSWNKIKGCYELASPFEAESPFDPHDNKEEDIPF